MRQYIRAPLVQIMVCRLCCHVRNWSLETHFSEILVKIQICSFNKMHLMMSPAKWWSFYLRFKYVNHWSTTRSLKISGQQNWLMCSKSVSAKIILKIFRVVGRVPAGGPERSWWRHRMETISAILDLCEGNTPITGGFPSQRPVTRSSDVCLIFASTNGWANNRDAGDLRRHRAHYDVTIIC